MQLKKIYWSIIFYGFTISLGYAQNVLPALQQELDGTKLEQLIKKTNRELQRIQTTKQKKTVKLISKALRVDLESDLETDLSRPINNTNPDAKVEVLTQKENNVIVITAKPSAANSSENVTKPLAATSAIAESSAADVSSTSAEPAAQPVVSEGKKSLDKDLLLAEKDMQLINEQEAKKQIEIASLVKTLELKNLRQQNIITYGSIGFGFMLIMAVLLFLNMRTQKKANQQLIIQKRETELAKNKSDELLLNILPLPVAEELKSRGKASAKHYALATVMFSDFKGFTQVAEKMTPTQLLESLDTCFAAFDEIISKYHLEKIKTIGDAYMCAGGIPTPNLTNPIECVLAGFEIQQLMMKIYQEKTAQGEQYWKIRLGINSGELIAGVIGKKKFAYDVWGDTVNSASRMESSGEVDKVNISGMTYTLVKDFFDCEYRGKIAAKNKGEVDMYFVTQIKPELSEMGQGLVPNQLFWQMLEQRQKA